MRAARMTNPDFVNEEVLQFGMFTSYIFCVEAPGEVGSGCGNFVLRGSQDFIMAADSRDTRG